MNYSLVQVQETSTSCLGDSDAIWDTDAWKHVILFTAGFNSLGMFSIVDASSPSWLNNWGEQTGRRHILFTLLVS